MLYKYLVKNYKPNEPIFQSDIQLPSVSNNNLRQMFKVLCDSGKLKRFDSGIYYLPSVSRLKGDSAIAPGVVARYKYIMRNDQVNGYYSGYTFANQLGISTQVPFTLEIVTNNAGAKYREVYMKGQRIVLRRPRATVDSENAAVLQFLDLLKDIEEYIDNEVENPDKKIIDYIRMTGITKSKMDQYICLYPDKTYRNLYEMGLYHVFA